MQVLARAHPKIQRGSENSMGIPGFTLESEGFEVRANGGHEGGVERGSDGSGTRAGWAVDRVPSSTSGGSHGGSNVEIALILRRQRVVFQVLW